MARKARPASPELLRLEGEAVAGRDKPFLAHPVRPRLPDAFVEKAPNEFRDGHALRLGLRIEGGFPRLAYVANVQRIHSQELHTAF